MAFNKLFKHIEGLIQNDDEVNDSVPCKADILTVRECRKGGKACDDLGLDLLRCMAQFKVDATEKVRTTIGVSKYYEYLKEMEDKHGKEKAAEIINEPSEQLKDIEAYQVLHRIANNTHPKGAPKTKDDLMNWTYADQVRLEMGEGDWWDAVKIIGYEFGLAKTDALFGLKRENDMIHSAQSRLIPGFEDRKASALAAAKKIEDSVKEAAPGGKTAADFKAAFDDLYPSKDDLEAALK
mmetsp:Transcript_25794/g.70875  ORF Transcript_25794/g.70875 Transcript_25794/m.70875 type:complete len:238 (-) Transcript_25794:148-861(-)|eukprot:CAMPEP_0172380958 /NCGR_PEP_ID=MMETSP1060-20121228/70706_1 /TAXON_ID=37318 /ORGANISM="Pseudo-nitzschia pungens, Strain cf. cingulata" /LENGTH=237 /DNA_ID=CAMNT_0013108725 /DNA_START=238 /DNA_END=951 /DNA_ORIENTATION=-